MSAEPQTDLRSWEQDTQMIGIILLIVVVVLVVMLIGIYNRLVALRLFGR